ncbi:carboxy terminal-processing peptidase [Dechloromonas denitrificans]|uniref:carboxy terminal-processing peptidase n=1 Tax=Dechloromonas denitrificans TaxID=281362 RepID=UPI001CFA4826|nr:carboxy terminal-processing peptidase [Dechloromonas denitrificans]UCV05978.1 carboxy terminal-processing peptidase [Dechloromonas denitrificans]
MRKNFYWLLLALSMSAQAVELSPSPQQAQAAYLTQELLNRFHYQAPALDDALSEKILERYLSSLDTEKYFFIQTDIDQLAGIRTRLDDAIISGKLELPFAIFNLYATRVIERFSYARSLLPEGFDFQQNETFQYRREKEPWPKSDAEARELWRKRVKNDWLRLKLAEKTDKSIIETLDKRYEASIKRIEKLKSEDAFQIFMNAYTTAIDPHTNYLGPRASENFGISMKLSLVGIGAVLEEKDEYTTIRELMAGGPAAVSGKLKVGDRIVGVGQGESGSLTDVLGWRLDDTVGLIRGEANSVVLLDILPADAGPDGSHKRISLIRKKITLAEQAAKKSVLPVTSGRTARKIGIISLPSFYQDFDARQKGDPNYKSATRDVARLLTELKKEKVDSILIDLRDNGGGSLSEAVELTGLFIDTGPVVQQRDARGRISVESDTQAGAAWNGPLGVLINGQSASASEIFAAAIQDYGRGLIIGEPSFGKGTVQSLLNLDRMARSDKQQYGELKMTIAQFFRIDGGTTQLRGVTPDIGFPTLIDSENHGEASFTNALPWGQIAAVDYVSARAIGNELPALLARHESRIKDDKEFKYLRDDLAEINNLRKKNQISLNEADRRQERETREAALASRETGKNHGKENARKISDTQRDDGLQASERSLSSELAAVKERKKAKDILLTEAVRILGDELELQTVAVRPSQPATKPAAKIPGDKRADSR